MRLSQLEEELDTVRRNNGLTLDHHDRDIAEMRAKLQELMGDYDELMNNKASLEFEINTYRRLLESEETRTTRVGSNAGNGGGGITTSTQFKLNLKKTLKS